MSRFSAIVVLACAFPIQSAFAAGLSGTVTDASGAPVAAAQVQLLTSLQAVAASTTTDRDGRFTLSDVERGRYVISVAAAGFAEHRVAVNLTDEPATVLVQLEIAALREDVTVAATPGSVEDVLRAAQGVSVITADELNRRVKTVVAEGVAEESGVTLQRTSPTMAGVFVRGLTGNKVNVFVDGVRYSNGAQRGGVNTFLDLIDPSFARPDRGAAWPEQRAIWQRRAGRQRAVPDRRCRRCAGAGARIGGRCASTRATRTTGWLQARRTHVEARQQFGLFASARPRMAETFGPGDGVDSHSAVTRFLGVPSDRLMDERLPDTGFQQIGAWRGELDAQPATRSSSPATSARGQDDGNRYDQLLGGDGNLIAELNGHDARSLLRASRTTRRRLVRSRVGHLLAQQPARRARESGRQRQPHRRRSGTSRNGRRRTAFKRADDARALVTTGLSIRRRRLLRESDL